MPRQTNATFEVEGGYHSDEMVRLRVTDRSSGMPILEIEFTATEWLGLSSGRVHTKDAWLTPHLDRIGKIMKHRTLSVPAEVTVNLSYNNAFREGVVRDWGKAQSEPGEHVEVRNTNQGWKVILRRYEEAEK